MDPECLRKMELDELKQLLAEWDGSSLGCGLADRLAYHAKGLIADAEEVLKLRAADLRTVETNAKADEKTLDQLLQAAAIHALLPTAVCMAQLSLALKPFADYAALVDPQAGDLNPIGDACPPVGEYGCDVNARPLPTIGDCRKAAEALRFMTRLFPGLKEDA